MLATVALLVGIGIGVFLREDPPEPQRPEVPVRAGSRATHPDTVDESASESSTTATRREEARAPTALAADDSRPSEPGRERVYRDETFEPAEPGLPYPQFVDETGADDDYERYGDGPVSAGSPESEDREATENRLREDRGESEAESCLPPFSSCRRDSDCCGASVCRSRPGTISGSFECTAD